jgi:hypothetical protein
MPHITSRSWTEADLDKLRKLSLGGASITRAAAALNRKTSAVAKVCRREKIQLSGTRELKAALRALDDQACFRVP